ncbi:hypothetical protein TWF696_001292 [Orbilia brochopaga]|uniref:Uncharacterized protein n=1 Tax=Orbilia brochopaga TaxID=3140254 RepID=A0AAV9U912_9PEZI
MSTDGPAVLGHTAAATAISGRTPAAGQEPPTNTTTINTTINTTTNTNTDTNPRESDQTIASRLTPSSCTTRSTTPFFAIAWPGRRGSGQRSSWQSTMMASKTPRVLLIFTRAIQIFCSILVLAAGIFSVVKFGVQQQEVLVVKEGSASLNVDYSSLPDGRGDWRPVLLVALSSVSLITFPLLTIFRRRRVSVAIEVILLALWCSFMTLYIPTITAPFEPNCLHPKAPFEFLDDHTSETKAIGIDIGRNSSTGGVGSSVDSDDGPRKINSAIHTYCVMSQVGVAAGVIVIIFTFLSILLLLLLSYQATDYLIERRALELLQHHALPSMVQRGIAPISNAYQTLASAIPPLRGAIPDEESNIHAHEYHPPSQRSVHVADGGITALHSSSGGRDGSFGGGMGMGMGVGMGMRPAVTNYVQPPLREKSGYTDVRSGTENAARSNHDRIQSGEQSVQQLQGWVTGGFEVDRR